MSQIWKHLIEQKAWIKIVAFLSFLAACWLTAPDVRLLDTRVTTYTQMTTWDPGGQFFFSAYRYLILDGKQATGGDVLVFELGMIGVCSLVLLLARAPLTVLLGGQLALFSIWLIFRSLSYPRYAVQSWAVVLSAGFLVALIFWRGRAWDYLSLMAYGTVLGYMPLMRQSAQLTAVLPALAVLVFASLVGFGWYLLGQRSVRRRETGPFHPTATVEAAVAALAASTERRKIRERAFKGLLHLLLALLLFCACVIIVQQVTLRVWTATQGILFKEHGTGYPLFMSLGFSNNPYNIAWDDGVAMARGLLVEKVPWIWYGADAAANERKLTELWLDYVLEDPAVAIEGMLAKTAYLLRYFSGTSDLQVTRVDGNPVRPSWVTTLLGICFLVAIALWGRLLFSVRGYRMVALFGGVVGLFLASIGLLVIIAPFYLGSAIAYCVVFILVLTPAAWSCAKKERRRNDKDQAVASALAYKLFFAACACVALGIAGYTHWRSTVNREEACVLLDAKLAPQLQELKIDYAHRFNRLSLGDQRYVLQGLLDTERDILVYRGAQSPGPATERAHIFAPILAFEHDDVVYVVAWMSSDWKMTLPSRLQGPRDSMIQVLRNTDQGHEKVLYFDAPWAHLKIANANWDGRYRMFCLPQLFPKSLEKWAGKHPEDFGVPVDFFHVSAFNFKGGGHMSGLVVAPVGEGRLVRPNDGP